MRWQEPPYTLFMRKVKVDESGCWLWLGAKLRYGHGSVRVYGKHYPAHKWLWEYLNGPTPDGLELDHLCRVPGCVNPDHLEAVTHRENLIRGCGPAGRARDTHCHRGHPYDEANTIHIRGTRRCRECVLAGQKRYKLRRKERVQPCKGQVSRTACGY